MEDIQKQIEQLKNQMNKLESLIEKNKEKGSFYYVNIEHADVQGPVLDKLDFMFDKIDLKEVSGALNLGNNFGVNVSGKKKKKNGSQSPQTTQGSISAQSSSHSGNSQEPSGQQQVQATQAQSQHSTATQSQVTHSQQENVSQSVQRTHPSQQKSVANQPQQAKTAQAQDTNTSFRQEHTQKRLKHSQDEANSKLTKYGSEGMDDEAKTTSHQPYIHFNENKTSPKASEVESQSSFTLSKNGNNHISNPHADRTEKESLSNSNHQSPYKNNLVETVEAQAKKSRKNDMKMSNKTSKTKLNRDPISQNQPGNSRGNTNNQIKMTLTTQEKNNGLQKSEHESPYFTEINKTHKEATMMNSDKRASQGNVTKQKDKDHHQDKDNGGEQQDRVSPEIHKPTKLHQFMKKLTRTSKEENHTYDSNDTVKEVNDLPEPTGENQNIEGKAQFKKDHTMDNTTKPNLPLPTKSEEPSLRQTKKGLSLKFE